MATLSQTWKEADRLQAIEDYGILDTPREDDYDDIAKLAAQNCDAPISAVTFVARDKQWFKAEVGLGIRETSLDVSICKHAMLHHGLFVVPDTTKDARFSTNAHVTGEPHFRFMPGYRWRPRRVFRSERSACSTISRECWPNSRLSR